VFKLNSYNLYRSDPVFFPADQVKPKPKARVSPAGKSNCPCNARAVLEQGRGGYLAMVSIQGFLSVVSPDSFLPFVPVFLSSVSELCPYPSCLCLPSRTSVSIVPPPASRPQPANSRWLPSLVPAPIRCPFTLRPAQCERIIKTPFMVNPIKPERRYWFWCYSSRALLKSCR